MRPSASTAIRSMATLGIGSGLAAARDWPTAILDAGHFHPLVDPDGVATGLLGLLGRR
jgi:hypothetical protein